MIRRSRFGFPIKRIPPSNVTATGFAPVGGYTELDDLKAPLGSWVSAANFIVQDGVLKPRSRLSRVGSNAPTVGVPNGAFLYDDIAGTSYAMVASSATVSYLTPLASWQTLTYASGVSNYPPSGLESDSWFGTSVYEPQADLNLALFTNGVDPLYAWEGPSTSTAFSTLTQGPICTDVVLFDNRPVAWNIQELGAPNRYVQRVQWPAAGAPYDWNAASIGAGFEDLVDMRGEGTRIFAEEDQLVLASTQEVWYGRRVGLPYVFQFDPLIREKGMPYKRAAVQCPLGIFFLDDTFTVQLLSAGQLQPVGIPIRDTLRRTLKDPARAFMGYDADAQSVTLFYSVTAGAYPTHAFTYHLEEKAWTPHTYQVPMTCALQGTVQTSGSTTWQDLTGTIAAQTGSYSDYLGFGAIETTFLTLSTGTTCANSTTRSGDFGTTSNDTVVAYMQTGALLHDPYRMKYADEVRVDGVATSASSLSCAVSGSLGYGYGSTDAVAFSVQSNSSQMRMPIGVSGSYFALRFQSDDTGFSVSRVFLRARDIGEYV